MADVAQKNVSAKKREKKKKGKREKRERVLTDTLLLGNHSPCLAGPKRERGGKKSREKEKEGGGTSSHEGWTFSVPLPPSKSLGV